VTAAVVLFCGAGGSSLGLERAGLTTIGFDHWPAAVWVHRAALMEAHVHDLADDPDALFSVASVLDERIPATPLMWASPPCQPFSTAGSGEGDDDERDGWPWTLRLVASKRPQVLIAENVPGMANRAHSDYLTSVIDALHALGYGLRWRILNAADYGVPQTRRRLFIVARRDGGAITWPEPTHAECDSSLLPWVTMAEALGWTGAVREARGAGMILRHGDRTPTPVTEPSPTITGHPDRLRRVGWQLDRRAHYVDGEPTIRLVDCDTEPAPTVTGTALSSAWTLTRPTTTVQGDPRIAQPGHHERQMRDAIRIEPHEAGVLQGFPADYPWHVAGSRSAQFRAIGNAVPPIMAQLLAEANRPVTS
jgi:DNA (cytosine-5)-methyltransferase 1